LRVAALIAAHDTRTITPYVAKLIIEDLRAKGYLQKVPSMQKGRC
jgi:hypothetical protein